MHDLEAHDVRAPVAGESRAWGLRPNKRPKIFAGRVRAAVSSEKYDMKLPDQCSTRIPTEASRSRSMHDDSTYKTNDEIDRQRSGVVIELDSLRARTRPQSYAIRCVSSGYLAEECSCPVSIPASVVEAAWAHERAASSSQESRFFHFPWRDEVWLGFGVADGRVRGVYCPTHRAERDARAAGCESHQPSPPARVAIGV
jgi:hypothetical protein